MVIYITSQKKKNKVMLAALVEIMGVCLKMFEVVNFIIIDKVGYISINWIRWLQTCNLKIVLSFIKLIVLAPVFTFLWDIEWRC